MDPLKFKHGPTFFVAQKHKKLESASRYNTVLVVAAIVALVLPLVLVARNSKSSIRALVPGLSSLLPGTTEKTTNEVPGGDKKTAEYRANIAKLVEEVKKHATLDIVDKCVAIIEARPGFLQHSWAQAGQDWLLFHNYFSHIPYGEGTYLDIGSNEPIYISNTFFFDRCLGWKGVCVEPNELYHEKYTTNRTCKLVKHCVSGRPEERGMNFEALWDASLLDKGQGSKVTCLRLSDVLNDNFGQERIELASLDIEGAEFDTLKCFPFRDHSIATWVVETNKADSNLFRLFHRGGYAHVIDLYIPWPDGSSMKTRMGNSLDSVFRLIEPPFIHGPDFIPGAKLHGKGPMTDVCEGGDCVEHLPVFQGFELQIRDECKATVMVPSSN